MGLRSLLPTYDLPQLVSTIAHGILFLEGYLSQSVYPCSLHKEKSYGDVPDAWDWSLDEEIRDGEMSLLTSQRNILLLH